MPQHIVLASASPHRKALLANAGVDFDVMRPDIDERAVEDAVRGSGVTPEDVASLLAESKALEVSARRPDALVVGCDQTLSLGDEILHKPGNMEEARRRLLMLSGRTHHLNSAVVLAEAGETVWRHVGIARMTMRNLDPAFVGRHLARVGEKVLSSVGAYQIEGEGVQLFGDIDGDLFTIIGLPLLPLLAVLRERQAIDG